MENCPIFSTNIIGEIFPEIGKIFPDLWQYYELNKKMRKRDKLLIIGYENIMLREEKEKLKEGYISQSLYRNILISHEIEKKIGSSRVFDEVLKTALSEISTILNEEWHGKIEFMIEVSIVQDYEYSDWKDTVIRIKVPFKDPKYVIQLWSKVSDRVWTKIGSIKENAEEIKRIIDNTRISFRILE